MIAGDATLVVELGPEAFRITGVSKGRHLRAEHADPFRRSIERFLDAAAAGKPDGVFCTPRDALQTLKVVEACERALATGDRVALNQ